MYYIVYKIQQYTKIHACSHVQIESMVLGMHSVKQRYTKYAEIEM